MRLQAILLIVLSLGLFGCATIFPKATKENLKSIYSKAQTGNIEVALTTIDGYADNTDFDTYSTNETVNAGEVKATLEKLKGTNDYCNKLLKSLESYGRSNSNEDDDNESMSLETLESDYNNSCDSKKPETINGPILNELFQKIKSQSSVDLSIYESSRNAKFKKTIEGIRSKAAEKDRQEDLANKVAVAKQEAYENSPEYYSMKLCEMNDRVKLGHSVIKNENESGKISGVVDKKRLYDAGQAIQINQRNIKHFSAEYKTKFGKEWNASQCK